MGDFSSLRILAAPYSLVAFSGKIRVLFSILEVPQNRHFRYGFYVLAPGKSHQGLEFGVRGVPGLQCRNLVVELREFV